MIQAQNIKKFLSKQIFLFVIFSVLSFSFEYNFLKLNILTPLNEKIVKQIAPYFLGSVENYTLEFYSDSTGMYFNLVLVLSFSMVIALLWTAVNQKVERWVKFDQIFAVFLVGICYYLALQMLIYGFSKLFKYQFYDAHPNTLFTPVGFLTKDFLYWTSMGSSRLFNIAIGLIEIAVALLLLFRKTRSLGALIGLIICLNITLINFAFDINVKIQSLFFLLLFLRIGFPSLKKLYEGFINHKTISIKPISSKNLNKHSKLKLGLKYVLVFFMFSEALYPYFKNNNFNGDTLAKADYYGAYSIENSDKYKRFFIHTDPYFIIQDKDDKLYSFKMKLTDNQIIINKNNQESILLFETKNGLIYIQGDFFGYPLNINGKKIKIDQMPLYEDTFHWTIDSYN